MPLPAVNLLNAATPTRRGSVATITITVKRSRILGDLL
jgi:hypothetical protein